MALAQQQQRCVAGRRQGRAFTPTAPARRVSKPSGMGLGLRQERFFVVRATAEEQEVKEVVLGKAAAPVASEEGWIPICRPEDVPKGVRKEFDVNGLQVLVFWYRNQLYAIESRSPAEGAYAEGFIKAKFTQDFCIECPSTGSLFSLKDGSIVSWYPSNPVLRALTPSNTCRLLEIYPVRITQDAVSVDTSNARLGAGVRAQSSRGGAGTSLEDNNVFSVQPTVYFEGQDPLVEAASVYSTGPASKLDPAIVTVGILAVGIVGVAGTATALYLEDVKLLAAFWVVLGGLAAVAGFNYVNATVKDDGSKRQ
ncbi:MAG: rieske [2Fe-2S] protein [Monoraphidium minutum]|nr:MAG: rieske [2Fe-2S] protein [Monoraphidium minutum]